MHTHMRRTTCTGKHTHTVVMLHPEGGGAKGYSRLRRRFGPLAVNTRFVFPQAPSRISSNRVSSNRVSSNRVSSSCVSSNRVSSFPEHHAAAHWFTPDARFTPDVACASQAANVGESFWLRHGDAMADEAAAAVASRMYAALGTSNPTQSRPHPLTFTLTLTLALTLSPSPSP